jgi:hypothetical protein
MHGRDAQVYRVGKDLVTGLPAVIREIVRERGEDVYAGQVMPPLLSRTHVQPVFTNGEFWGEFDTPEEHAEVDRLVTAAERSERGVEAYGLVRASRSQIHSTATRSRGATAFLAALRRARNVVRERRLPSKLARPGDLMRALPVRPLAALRFAWPLLTRRMSRKAFLLQIHGAEILSVFMEEAGALGVRPFLAWGTLLGCVRDDTFIYNDEDVDVGLLEKDFTKVEELKARMLARGYSVRRQDADKISFFHPTATGLHIDVDRFFRDDDCYWIRSEHSEDEFIYSNFFPLATFDDLVTTHFAGADVYVPGNPDLFLRSVYGTWQIPEEKHDIRRGTLNLYMRHR